MRGMFKKSGLSAIFTASAFALFSAASSPAMSQDLYQDQHSDGAVTLAQNPQAAGSAQSLVEGLKNSGFDMVGYGAVFGEQGPVGYLAIFADEQNDWRMVRFDPQFRMAQVINEGHSFSAITYRYNMRVDYNPSIDGGQFMPVQTQQAPQNENASCMSEFQFGSQFLQEDYAKGYLLQGYDSDNDIMKLYINDEGSFLGASTEQNAPEHTTCGQFQGEGFHIAENFMPVPRVAP